MEYLIIGLICLLIILVIILIIKSNKPIDNRNNLDMIERLGRFENNITKTVGEFKNELNRDIDNNFIKINDNLDYKIDKMNEKVHERIDQNFEKTNKTFNNVIERLSKIDEAQKKIEELSTDIVSLEDILTDKKTRGIYGEVNLNSILKNVFGERNDSIFRLQYQIPGYDVIADSVVFAPKPMGMLIIDSKFPLENYRIMVDKNENDIKRTLATKEFKLDVKKHIDDIANKYIIPGVTSDQAMMFIPAEAIFAEINAYHGDLVEYAYKKRVWLASPTTLISTLTMILVVIKDIEKDKYAGRIHEELNKLGIEFTRFKDRFDKLSRSVKSVTNDLNEFEITTNKIKTKFDNISNVEIKDIDLIEDDDNEK